MSAGSSGSGTGGMGGISVAGAGFNASAGMTGAASPFLGITPDPLGLSRLFDDLVLDLGAEITDPIVSAINGISGGSSGLGAAGGMGGSSSKRGSGRLALAGRMTQGGISSVMAAGSGDIAGGIAAAVAPLVAVAGPFAALAAIVTGLALAFKALMGYSEGLVDAFKAASPHMAALAAKRDIRNLLRDMRTGNLLADEQERFLDAQGDLKDALAPLLVSINNTILAMSTGLATYARNEARGVSIIGEFFDAFRFHAGAWQEAVERAARKEALAKNPNMAGVPWQQFLNKAANGMPMRRL